MLTRRLSCLALLMALSLCSFACAEEQPTLVRFWHNRSSGANLEACEKAVDEFNNTILVWSTGSQFRKIEASLKRLDVAPIQVLIEASIIEVTLNDSLRYGVEWLFKNNHLGGSGRDYTGFGNFGGFLFYFLTLKRKENITNFKYL